MTSIPGYSVVNGHLIQKIQAWFPGYCPGFPDCMGTVAHFQVDLGMVSAANNGTLPNGDVPLNPHAQAVFSQPVLQTTAATMTNPCTYVGWTAAAATAGAGGVAVAHAGEITAAAAENAPTITSRILQWWFNLTSRPGKPGLVRAAAATAVAAKDAVVSTCKSF